MYDSIYMKCPELIEIDGRLVAARGWREEGMGSDN